MTEFDVVERRDIIAKRQDRYLSFPGMVRAPSGRILLAYRDALAAPGTFSHGRDGDLMLTRHDGRGWSSPELLYQHEGPIEEMGCGDLARLSDGTTLLWSRQYDAARSRTHEVYLARSTDDGDTFTPRRPVRLPAFPQVWVPYGKAIELPDGRLLQGGYGVRAAGERSSAACLVSPDRGEHWELLSWIAEGRDPAGLNYYEPFMFLLPDGSLYALLRTNGRFHATRSDDGGRTWREPVPAFEGMACAGLVLADGRMLVAYRGIHEKPGAGRPPTVAARCGRLYCFRLSDDGGTTWSPERVIDDGTAYQVGSYGMGDLLELGGGRVKAVYYTSDADQAPWLQECLLVPKAARAPRRGPAASL